MQKTVAMNEPSECLVFRYREDKNFPWSNYWQCPLEVTPRERLRQNRCQGDHHQLTFNSIRFATSSNSQNIRLFNVITGGTPMVNRKLRELVEDECEEALPFVDISAAFRTCWIIKDGTRTLRRRHRVAKQVGAQMTICSFNGRKKLVFIGHGSRAKM